MHARTQQLVDELRNWCSKGYGRQSAAAKAIGISRQALNLWLKGTQGPSGEQALALLDFLADQRTKKR
jgi:DNA-binding XRE family transcriptional regulator